MNNKCTVEDCKNYAIPNTQYCSLINHINMLPASQAVVFPPAVDASAAAVDASAVAVAASSPTANYASPKASAAAVAASSPHGGVIKRSTRRNGNEQKINSKRSTYNKRKY